MEIHLYKQKNSKFWWMRYTENGQLVRKSTKCAKKSEAKDVADLEREQWKRRIGIGVREPITLKDLIQEVEKDYSLNGKKSADRIEYSKKHLVEILGENTPIEKITEHKIDEYKQTRKQGKCENETLNRELALLRGEGLGDPPENGEAKRQAAWWHHAKCPFHISRARRGLRYAHSCT